MKGFGFGANTLIILTSDHGFHIGEHFQFGKHTLYEEGTRVPLMVMNPDLKGQTLSHFEFESNLLHAKKHLRQPAISIKSPVELLDIFPTVLEAVDLPAIENCPAHNTNVPLCTQGKSLVGMKDGAGETFAISQYPKAEKGLDYKVDPKVWDIRNMGYSVRSLTMRYTRWVPYDMDTFRPRWRSSAAEEELYDYASDPQGNVNVAQDPKYSQKVRKLKRYIRARIGRY